MTVFTQQLYVCRLPAAGKEAEVKWVCVSEMGDVPPSLATSTVQYLELKHENSENSVSTY